MVNVPYIVGYVLILIGLIGAVVPVLPGPFLIWLGALVWAWGDGFVRVGWPTLIVLLLLAIAAWASDLFLNVVIGRRSGGSWKAILAAIGGGLLGGILFSGVVPVLGTLFGALIGAIAGVFAAEWWDKRDRRAALTAVRAYISSMIIAAVVEVIVAVSMVGLFAWQAFL